MKLDYRLVVLTNGRPCLRETLEAFRELARPEPTDVLMLDDGDRARPFGGAKLWKRVPVLNVRLRPALGFCGATTEAWKLAANFEPRPWIFWLEDDFVLEQPLDLDEIADVLDVEPQVAQMALYRDAYSSEERDAGGYLDLPGRSYAPRVTLGHRWFEHEHYWTTNPSLFRSALARRFEPLDEPECEGKLGFRMRASGFLTFGVWGDGSTTVRHVGVRSGHGY